MENETQNKILLNKHETHNNLKYIFAISFCIVFIYNGIAFGYKVVRRSTDDKVKIIQAEKEIQKDTSEQEQRCIEAGGLPDYWKGKFIKCKRK